MKVLITGAGGLVGGGLIRARPDDTEVVGVIRSRRPGTDVELVVADLAEPQAFAGVLDTNRPEVVVHCAFGLRDGPRDIVAATKHVARACGEAGVDLVHLSSDLVFDGRRAPYGEDAPTHPVFDHGLWKQTAETLVGAVAEAAILRTSLVVSLDPLDRSTAQVIETMGSGQPFTFFDDEYRTPILIDDLVASIWELVRLGRRERAGVWHIAGPERMSRWQLGQLILGWFDLDPALARRVSAEDLGIDRPRDTSLSCRRALSRLSVRPRPLDTVTAHGQATR